ncbi:unnamed protein product, partial [Cochlearia groenlandica]
HVRTRYPLPKIAEEKEQKEEEKKEEEQAEERKEEERKEEKEGDVEDTDLNDPDVQEAPDDDNFSRMVDTCQPDNDAYVEALEVGFTVGGIGNVTVDEDEGDIYDDDIYDSEGDEEKEDYNWDEMHEFVRNDRPRIYSEEDNDDDDFEEPPPVKKQTKASVPNNVGTIEDDLSTSLKEGINLDEVYGYEDPEPMFDDDVEIDMAK